MSWAVETAGGASRRALTATGAAALAVALAGAVSIATSSATSIGVASWFGEPLMVGAALLAAGLAGWALRPESRVGPLLCVAAVVSWAPYVQDSPIDLLASGGYVLREVYVAVLIHVAVSYPSGRLSKLEAAIVSLAYLKVLVPNLATALLLPLPAPLEHRNFFVLASHPSAVASIDDAVDTYVAYALGAAIAVLMLVRIARGTRVARAAAVPLLIGSALTLVYFTFRDFTCGGFLAWSGSYLHSGSFEVDWLDTLTHAAIPVAFLLALSRGGLVRGRMGGLLIDIGERPDGLALRDALVRALGDPTLSLAYRSSSTGVWLDPDGEPVALPADETTRAVSFLERDGEPVAAIIHDPALRDEPERLEPVRRAVRLLLDNERLTADVRRQLVEIRASRQRIVQAADEARKRVERDLHDGAQQRLLGLALSLRLAERTAEPSTALMLRELAEEMEAAIAELRELARGIHPSILTERGLDAALRALGDRSSVPVVLDVETAQRFPEAIEATAYYLVAEALTNVARYARATVAHVTVLASRRWLWVEIRDDGVGGARIGQGSSSGLAGLRDRIDAVGGTLMIDSPPGGGTRILAALALADGAPVPDRTEVPEEFQPAPRVVVATD
jgi:signal transduction histidine kinase